MFLLVPGIFLLAKQNESENHMEKNHDSLLHVCGRTLKMGIFGLENP